MRLTSTQQLIVRASATILSHDNLSTANTFHQICAEDICIGECAASYESDRNLFFAIDNTDNSSSKTLCYQVQIADCDSVVEVKGKHAQFCTVTHPLTHIDIYICRHIAYRQTYIYTYIHTFIHYAHTHIHTHIYIPTHRLIHPCIVACCHLHGKSSIESPLKRSAAH
jgi:hypothetical protein